MLSWLLRAFRRDSDEIPTRRAMLERLADIEDRADRLEARQHEWVGTIKRVLARINKAEERAEVVEPENGNALTREELDRRAQRYYHTFGR